MGVEAWGEREKRPLCHSLGALVLSTRWDGQPGCNSDFQRSSRKRRPHFYKSPPNPSPPLLSPGTPGSLLTFAKDSTMQFPESRLSTLYSSLWISNDTQCLSNGDTQRSCIGIKWPHKDPPRKVTEPAWAFSVWPFTRTVIVSQRPPS